MNHQYDEAHLDHGHWIETVTGQKFHQTHPEVSKINLTDITHSLSLICRYNGHVKRLYSVGHHVLFVADMIQRHAAPYHSNDEMKRLALLGLMHDFEEAYTGDIIGSLKMTMKAEIPGFREWWTNFTSLLEADIHEAFDVPGPSHGEERLVKFFDVRALAIESQHVLPHGGHTFGDVVRDNLEKLSGNSWLPADAFDPVDNKLMKDIWKMDRATTARLIELRFAALRGPRK